MCGVTDSADLRALIIVSFHSHTPQKHCVRRRRWIRTRARDETAPPPEAQLVVKATDVAADDQWEYAVEFGRNKFRLNYHTHTLSLYFPVIFSLIQPLFIAAFLSAADICTLPEC